MSGRTCQAPNCPKAIPRGRYCGVHYERLRRHGSLELPPRPTTEERFWAKVRKTETCWLWTATKNEWGYGHYKIGKKMHKAHRLAYELLIGTIPDGLVLDHLCRNPACVNPAHLEPVTQRENINRGVAAEVSAALNLAKTHCPHGHEYSPENTRLNSRGHRECITCLQSRRNKGAA